MYENFRKPRLLADVPVYFVRPLPVIYYFYRFRTGAEPSAVQVQLFKGSIAYLREMLSSAGQIVESNQFSELADSHFNSVKEFENFSLKLAQLCSVSKNELEIHRKSLMVIYKKLFDEMVRHLKIIMICSIENRNGAEKIQRTLSNLCAYHVSLSAYTDQNYRTRLEDIDFITCYYDFSTEYRNHIDFLKAFGKPMMLIADPAGDKNLVRKNSQLIKSGFDLLVSYITPMRLFTGIEKIYMRDA